MDPDWLVFDPEPSRPTFVAARRVGRRALSRLRSRRRVPLRRRTQVHAVRRRQGPTLRPPRFPRLRQERDRPGHVSRYRQSRDARRAGLANGSARGVATVRPDVSHDELPTMHEPACAPCDSTTCDDSSIPNPTSTTTGSSNASRRFGWHVVIYFEAADLAERWKFFTSLETDVVVDHMGRPDVTQSVDGPDFAQVPRR